MGAAAKFPATAEAVPFGGAGIERSEMTERVLLSSPCPIKPENDPLKM